MTVNVTNVDEAPVIMEGGLAVSGPGSQNYAEGGMDAVGELHGFRNRGSDFRYLVVWRARTAGDFRVEGSGESVMLRFRTSAPDYEMPMDMPTMDNVPTWLP